MLYMRRKTFPNIIESILKTFSKPEALGNSRQMGAAGRAWTYPTKGSNFRWCYFSLVKFYMKKNQRCSWIPSKNIDDKRILQSDWMRVFWPKTCEAEFSQIWGLHREIENCRVFHLRLLPAKVMKQILRKFKKTSFWTNFGSFLCTLEQTSRKISLRHPFLLLHFYRCAKFLEKIMSRFREKLVQDVRADIQTRMILLGLSSLGSNQVLI